MSTHIQTHETIINGMLCAVKIHQVNGTYIVTSYMANCISGYAPYRSQSLNDANGKAQDILDNWAKNSTTC